jgi:hypothetical protein
VLADKLRFPGKLAVDDRFVYFTVEGGVMRIAKTGGTPEQITKRRVAFIALDDQFIYLTDQGPARLQARDGGPGKDMKRGEIVQIAKDGKSPERVLARGLSEPSGIAIDATTVYTTVYTEYDPAHGSVLAISKSNGAPKVLARNRRGPNALRLEGHSLYWIDRPATEAEGVLVTLNLATGTVQTLDNKLYAPMDLAVDISGLYYASLQDSYGWHANPTSMLATDLDDTGAVLRRSK